MANLMVMLAKAFPWLECRLLCGKSGGILRFNADCTARRQFETP